MSPVAPSAVVHVTLSGGVAYGSVIVGRSAPDGRLVLGRRTLRRHPGARRLRRLTGRSGRDSSRSTAPQMQPPDGEG